MNATTILCILLLSLYLLLAVFWIVRSIIDTIDDHKRDKSEVWIESERLYEVLYSFEMEV